MYGLISKLHILAVTEKDMLICLSVKMEYHIDFDDLLES